MHSCTVSDVDCRPIALAYMRKKDMDRCSRLWEQYMYHMTRLYDLFILADISYLWQMVLYYSYH
jgi:hypothetical protein